MLFNSIGFAVFFPAVVIIYFLLWDRLRERRWPNLWLLLASYFFYGCADPRFALLLFAVTLITWGTGFVTGSPASPAKKKRTALIVGTAANLSILLFFKYFNLLYTLFEKDPAWKVLLPVGISFYIFQSLTYIFDTYGGKCETERDFPKYALFVSFFPVLLAGPIERAAHLLPQFEEKHSFDYERTRRGLIRMAYGYFLKLAISQRLAIAVDLIYDHFSDCTGYQLFLATVLYAFQIYCDFASYSSIAIGAAQIMGFELTENFRQPFLSKSCGELWRRWHISLNSWFKDYLYIPLGGNRKGRLRKYLNVMFVFTLSGIWHGAELHYVLWGALSGLFQVLGDLLKPVRKKLAECFPKGGPAAGKLHHMGQVLITFLLFTVSLVFFRAESSADALFITRQIWTRFEPASILTTSPFSLGLGVFHLMLLLIAMIMMVCYDLINEKTGDAAAFLLSRKTVIRWIVYYTLVVMILSASSIGAQQFIYFEF